MAAGLPPRPAPVSTCPWAAPDPSENRGRKKTPTGSTCPWEVPAKYVEPIKKSRAPIFDGCAGSGAPKIGQSRNPSPGPGRQSTCPWNDGSDIPNKPKKRGDSVGRSPRITCPWEGSEPDRDSVALKKAAQGRQRGGPVFEGCAGSGAPKPRPQAGPQPVMQNLEAINVEDGDLAAEALNENGGNNEHAIIRHIIDIGLEKGLSRDEIEAEIDAYYKARALENADKENEMTIKVEAKNNPQMPATAVAKAASVAAQRQKMAAQRAAPGNQEVVNILKEHSPPDTPGSRVAYAQNQHSAAAIREKNRGVGIF